MYSKVTSARRKRAYLGIGENEKNDDLARFPFIRDYFFVNAVANHVPIFHVGEPLEKKPLP